MEQGERFYMSLEDGVRDWVRWLRDAGINTEISCGHEGYIQCQTSECSFVDDINCIANVLQEHELDDYEIEYLRIVIKDRWTHSIFVRAKAFKAMLEGGG